MRINLITAFPEFYTSFLNTSLVKKSTDNKLINFSIIDLKNFGIGKFPKIDDTQYGGGNGMVIRVDVVKKALDSIADKGVVIALTAKGDTYNQKMATNLSETKTLTILNGRYEGFDERVFNYVHKKISIGNFITLGGESPSLCLIESVIRLVPGVLGKIESTELESHGAQYKTKHPVFTKPKVFDSLEVPEVLVKGNHEKIKEWRLKNSKAQI